ncbi:MAG: TMEM165/GDT1 family protein [Candidatus Omnitrophota bacterium]
MDWKIFVTTFFAVFVAELADKTQLVGIGMASKSGKPFSVWAGSVTAYLLITAASVFLGALLGKYLRPDVVKIAGAVLFIVIGFLMLWGKV